MCFEYADRNIVENKYLSSGRKEFLKGVSNE
jgi:hypothetical protein